MPARDPSVASVAVVGMAAVFPGAPDLTTFWRNIVDGIDAITDVPESRWEPVFFDPHSRSADRFYCRRGGFVDAFATFDPAEFGIMPVAVEEAEPDQLLALRVASDALKDAGPSVGRAARERTGVILGRGGYLTPGVARLEQRVRTAQQLVECLRGLLPNLSEEELARVKQEFQAQLGPERPEGSIGLVPNLAASRIANRLDLQGPAYTVDAACASSLIAVDHAVRELLDGRCDLVVAGGVHHCHDVTFWSVFSQLRALSPSGQIRPFDRNADGILIGEGTGMIVLKRFADALRDDDRIYAVIRGSGVASDGRESSLMKPRVEGQLLALERAWKMAGCEPAHVGLIEAHGTGTPAGDEAELRTLSRFFGTPESGAPRAGLGSVKSMIGHAMPAAGVAGLIKAVLAVHHGVLPPTLHCDEPHPQLAETRFRPIARAEPWEANGELRLAGVNAFGFGGINAHLVVEACEAPRRAPAAVAAVTAAPDRVWLFAAESVGDLLHQLDRSVGSDRPDRSDRSDRVPGSSPPTHQVRLAVVNPTPERLATVCKVVERGRPWHGRNDIWFTTRGLATDGGKIAFLFPGVEAIFDPQIEDVADHFGLTRLDVDGGDLESQGFGIIGVGRLVDAALDELGVHADEVAGHSIGEWSGMIATGVVPGAAVDRFVADLQRGNLQVPDVVFAAVGCGVEKAAAAIEGLDDISISHDNCPHQSILCGHSESVHVARERLRAQRVLSEELPFRSGFHSPLFAEHLGPFLEHLDRLPIERPRTRLWSATTCAPYPDDPAAIRELVAAHFVKPVRFREVVDRLYAEGVRIFVQTGLGSLTGFVGDTLKDRAHLSIAALAPRHPGLAQFRRLAAALFVEGVPVKLERLFAAASEAAEPTKRTTMPQRLALGVPLVRLERPLAVDVASASASQRRGDPLFAQLDATLREAASAGKEVLDALRRRSTDHDRGSAAPLSRSPGEARRGEGVALPPPGSRPPAPESRRITVRHRVSVDTMPELLDHCFYRQPADWPHVNDRFPVVPMTAMIQLMIEAARKLIPGRVVVGLDTVRAFRWLAPAPTIDATIRARADDHDRVKVSLDGYASATVLFADRYPPPPAPSDVALTGSRPAPLSCKELYSERWMFHGPAYQGIVDLGPVYENGIQGVLENGRARGALLDNAGQLMGYWAMLHTERDRLALPTGIERIRFYGPDPVPGRRFDCRVWIRELDDVQVRADHELVCDGQVWARIEDWTDKRFDSDDIVWPMLRFPEEKLLADPGREPYVLVRERWRSTASRELIMRRYLNEDERREYDSKNPRVQRTWLLGRIAAKDAVRRWLWARGAGPIFPVEIRVGNDAKGKPTVSGPFREDLRVSIAHKEGIAVAMVIAGNDPGVDVELIAPRKDRFAEAFLTDVEQQLDPQGTPTDEWLTRLWTVKEAAAKARGTGFDGRPKNFVVHRAEAGRLRVDESVIESKREGDFIVSWTQHDGL